jgi:hypothetical protein
LTGGILVFFISRQGGFGQSQADVRGIFLVCFGFGFAKRGGRSGSRQVVAWLVIKPPLLNSLLL